MDKKFVGRCSNGKYDGQVEIGLTRDDLTLLTNSLNERGWVNIRVSKGRDSGKPYAEIIAFTKDEL